jgi:hypothetical protein
MRHRCVAASVGLCIPSFEGYLSKRRETLIQRHSVTFQKNGILNNIALETSNFARNVGLCFENYREYYAILKSVMWVSLG